MILVFNITEDNVSIVLPIRDLYKIKVNWYHNQNNNKIYEYRSDYNQMVEHQYSKKGKYTVKITGYLRQFGFSYCVGDTELYKHYSNYSNFLIECKSFEDVNLLSLKNAFKYCSNLLVVPKSIPSTVTNLSGMFYCAHSFNSPINSWDTSNVNDMSEMFYCAVSFKSPLNSWDTSNVTHMNEMFYKAKLFNSPLDSWDISKVVDMRYMFHDASSFNQSLDCWDISSVKYKDKMFNNTT